MPLSPQSGGRMLLHHPVTLFVYNLVWALVLARMFLPPDLRDYWVVLVAATTVLGTLVGQCLCRRWAGDGRRP